MAAIVQRAARGGPRGVKLGDHEAADIGQLCCWPSDTHGRLTRDAAVKEGVKLVFPFAAAVFADFNDGYAVVVDFFEHFELGARE